jgi:hypothetical protein
LIAVVNERKIVFCSEQCGGEAHEDVEATEKRKFFPQEVEGDPDLGQNIGQRGSQIRETE